MSEDAKQKKPAKVETVFTLPDKTEIKFPCRLKTAGNMGFTDTEENVRYSPNSIKRHTAPQPGSWLACQLEVGNIVVDSDDD